MAKRKITLERVSVFRDGRAFFDVWGVFVYDGSAVETLFVTNDRHVAAILYELASELWYEFPVEKLKEKVADVAAKRANVWRREKECAC